MQHAGIRDLAHHLAARAVIFGNADGLAKLWRRQAAQAGRHGRDPQRVPGARRVIVGDGGMKRQPGPPGNLVAKRDEHQRLGAAHRLGLFGQRQQRRNDGHADMAFDRIVAVMRVEIVGLGRGGIGGPGKTGLAPVEQHPRLVGRVAGTVEQAGGIAGDAACLHRAGGGGNAKRVEKHQRGIAARGVRHILGSKTEREIRHPRHHSVHCAFHLPLPVGCVRLVYGRPARPDIRPSAVRRRHRMAACPERWRHAACRE